MPSAVCSVFLVRFYKLLQHIDESVSILICKVSVQIISLCTMSPFHDCALHVVVSAHVKLEASRFNMS